MKLDFGPPPRRERYVPNDIGPSPESWLAPRLEQISTLITNGFVGTATPYYTDETAVKYLYGSNVRENAIDYRNLRYITKAFHSDQSKTRLLAGDLLTVQSGHIGVTAVVPTEFGEANCHALIVTRLSHKLMDAVFASHYLNSEIGKARMRGLEVGSTILHINTKDLKKFRVPLPPLPEQQRIAAILSTWDRAIEAVEALIANASAQKKALMQSLLTAKKRLPGFAREWDNLKIEVLADLLTGGTPSTAKPEYWGGNIPWMSSGEINLREIHAVEGRITERGLEESSAKIVPLNSVLIALAGQGKTRGKVAISRIPLCTNQSVATIVPNQKLSSDYLFHNLDSRYDELRSLSLGDGGRGGLNLSVLRSIQVPVPEIDEQIAIASILRSADEQVELLESKRVALYQEKSALMQQLLTGQRRVKVDEGEDA